MTKYSLSEIYIYPVKSLGGISLLEAEVTDKGLKHDRRFMLVDNEGKFLSQRRIPEMSLLQCGISGSQLEIFHKHLKDKQIVISLTDNFVRSGKFLDVFMWNETIKVYECSLAISRWFSDILNVECRLVYMPDNSLRPVDRKYAHKNENTSLSDGYPFLIIGQESLNLLNSKLDKKVSVNRFRPNFVFTGGNPHDEDKWEQFKIKDITFRPVKPCARCSITTVNQDTAELGNEPLKTLSFYRRSENNKVLFGMNLLHEGRGVVVAGDTLDVSIF
ncbi:MAG: MOSC domain-containing protein [Melioribacteraceae bacterium]|nr:MOSC domain-containing protein [Melioribacteraceae bacterium]